MQYLAPVESGARGHRRWRRYAGVAAVLALVVGAAGMTLGGTAQRLWEAVLLLSADEGPAEPIAEPDPGPAALDELMLAGRPIEERDLEIAEVAPAAPPAPVVADAPDLRVVIYHPRADQGAGQRAARLARDLEEAGYQLTAVRPVDFTISASHLRFFHDEDRSAGDRLRATLASGAEEVRLRDFTRMSPRPSPGSVELFLASRPNQAQ